MTQKAPTSPLKYLWKSLETLTTLQAVKEEWKTLLQDEFSSVEPLLTPCPDLATSFPRRGRSRMGLPLRVVQHGDDDFVAVCDETGERYILSRSDLIVYRVFIPRLFSVLAQAIGLSEATVPLAPDFPALVGIFQHGAGVGRPVFLDIPRCQKDVERTLQQLNAQQSQSFVLLTPTATLLSSKSTELLSVRRSLHVSLDSAIIIDGSNRWVLNSDVRGKLNSDSVSNVESVRGRSVLGQQTSQQTQGMEETLHNDNIVDPEFKMTTKEQAKPQFLIVADNPSWLFQGTTSVLNGRGAALYEIEDESRAKDLIELFEEEMPNCPFKLAVCHYRELSPIQIKRARKQLNLAYQAIFAWHFENPLIKDFKSNELHKYGVKLSELDHELKRLTREAAEFKIAGSEMFAPVIKSLAIFPPATELADSLHRVWRALEHHRLIFLFSVTPTRINPNAVRSKTGIRERILKEDVPGFLAAFEAEEKDERGEFLFKLRKYLDAFADSAYGHFGSGEGLKADADGASYPFWSLQEEWVSTLQNSTDSVIQSVQALRKTDTDAVFNGLVQASISVVHDMGQSRWYCSHRVTWQYLERLDAGIHLAHTMSALNPPAVKSDSNSDAAIVSKNDPAPQALAGTAMLLPGSEVTPELPAAILNPHVDKNTFTVLFDGHSCELRNTKEFALFERLHRRIGQYFSVDTLVADVWNDEMIGKNTVQKTVGRLRQKLHQAGCDQIEIDGTTNAGHYAMKIKS